MATKEDVATIMENKYLGILLLLLAGCTPIVAIAEKPQGPITVEIKSAGRLSSGSSVSFEVTAVSLLDGEMTITLFPPAGAKVTAGELIWRGEVSAHARKRVSLTVELPLSEQQEFRATATMTDVNGARFGSGARYPITTKSAPTIKHKYDKRNGQAVIEVPLPAKK